MVEESKKKKTFTFFTLEFGIILIVILVLLVILNYLSLVPLSKMSPALFGFLPHITTGAAPTVSKLDKNSRPDILALSTIKGYTLTVRNKEKLIQLLTDWKIINGNFTNGTYVRGDTNNKAVKKVTAILTDRVEETNQLTNKTIGVYVSSMATAEPHEMKIYVQLLPAMLNGMNTFDKFYLFDIEFLTTVYRLVHPGKTTLDIQSELGPLFSGNMNNKILFFEISKK